MAHTYFITFHTYATWLHGDARGSVTPGRAAPGTPFAPADEERKDIARLAQRQPALTLDEPMRRLVHATIVEACEYRKWELLALNVRSTHVHLVVFADRDPEGVRSQLKARCSRLLVERGLVEKGRDIWSRHGSTRWITSEASRRAAIEYVLHCQGGSLVGDDLAWTDASEGPKTYERTGVLGVPFEKDDGGVCEGPRSLPLAARQGGGEVVKSKREARVAARERVAAIDVLSRDQRSRVLCDHLVCLPEWSAARSVLVFVPMDDEPDVRGAIIAAIAEGKVVGVPRMEGGGGGEAGVMTPVRVSDFETDLERAPGFARVMQPRAGLPAMDVASLDVVLVPGLAFDRRGNRLGRGRGFYDRFLASFAGRASRPVFVGIALDVQIVEQLPTEEFDVRVDVIVTESGIHRTGGSGRA